MASNNSLTPYGPKPVIVIVGIAATVLLADSRFGTFVILTLATVLAYQLLHNPPKSQPQPTNQMLLT